MKSSLCISEDVQNGVLWQYLKCNMSNLWFLGETWLKRQYDTMLAQQAYLAAQHGHFTLKLLLPLTLSL